MVAFNSKPNPRNPLREVALISTTTCPRFSETKKQEHGKETKNDTWKKGFHSHTCTP